MQNNSAPYFSAPSVATQASGSVAQHSASTCWPPDNRIRAALSLNNTGVTLLERRCYRQALITLKEATRILQDPPRATAKPEEEANELQDLLQKATQRLTNPQIMNVNDRHSRLEIQAISLEDLILSAPPPATRILRPIRVEEFDSALLPEYYSGKATDSFDLESAVVVHNFGLAHVCISRSLGSSMSSHGTKSLYLRDSTARHCRLQACAKTLMLTSDSLLGKRIKHILMTPSLTADSTTAPRVDESHLMHLLHLATVFLQNLEFIYHGQPRQQSRVETLQGKLRRLQCLIRELTASVVDQGTCQTVGSPGAPAA